MVDDHPGAVETARSYLSQLDDTESPLTRPRPHGSASRPSAWVARRPVSRPTSCGTARRVSSEGPGRAHRRMATDVLRGPARPRRGLRRQVRRRAGRRPVPRGDRLAEPFGAYFALEPRLNLATELLAHGGRDEGRELLVACWSTAHDMGAHDLERRASRLATRTRVPLPQSAAREGPLSRLTPREREVLDLLATGATNKTISRTLFITEKTASVHVSNILAKLGVANRGEAAAFARHLVETAATDGSGPPAGTRVVALVRRGAWAELAAVSTSWMATIPDAVPDHQAATLPDAGLTALRSLEVGGFLLGKRVLVTGAGGGVGSFATQLADAAGAHVTALVRTAREIPGASVITERIEGDFDLIVDAVGGPVFGQAIEHLATRGLVVNLATPDPDEPVHFRPGLFDRSQGARIYTLNCFDGLRRARQCDLRPVASVRPGRVR